MAPKLHDQAHKAQLPICVGAVLDDYGLTAAQFRLYGHTGRRGKCWAAIDTIAQVCRMSKNTVRRNLKFLVSQRLIDEATRTGLTTVYRLNPESQWKPNPNQKRVGVATTPPKRQEATPTNWQQATPTKRQGEDPYQNRVGKGSPSEGSPLKAFPLRENALSAALGMENTAPPNSRDLDFPADLRTRLERIIPHWRDHHFSVIYRQNPQKFERVLAEVECQVREGKILHNPGGYFTDTWQRFK